MATLATFRTELRIDLGAPGDTTNYPNGHIDRAVQRAVRDLSKYIPRERVFDHLVDWSISAESFTSNHGTAVSLANGFIKPGSEEVHSTSGGGTVYTKDTDYTMDYANGTITVLASGSISDSTTVYIDYTIVEVVINISTLEVIRVKHVQIYPFNIPQMKVVFQQWGDHLFISGQGDDGQVKLKDGQHVWVYYETEQAAPLSGTAGGYPVELDEIVSKGAVSYLLRGKAAENTLQVEADATSARTEVALSNAALDKMDGHQTSAETALDKISDLIIGATTSMEKVLDDMVTEIDQTDANSVLSEMSNANTQLNLAHTAMSRVDEWLADKGAAGSNPNAVDQLSDVENLTDSAKPFKDADSALDLASTAIFTNAQASLTSAEGIFATQDNFIISTSAGGTVPSAAQYLIDGDGKISTINDGEQEAEQYRKYSESSLGIADQFADQRKDYITQANVEARIGEAHIQIARTRLAEVEAKATLSTKYVDMSRVYITEAAERVRSAAGFLGLSDARIRLLNVELGVVAGYGDAVAAQVAEGAQRIAQAQARAVEAQGYLAIAAGYLAAGRHNMDTANLFHIQADAVRDEFFAVLRDKSLYTKQDFQPPTA